MTSLRGITWDHPRGYQGLYTATNAYHELRPDVRIEWEKHSLHHFESHPIADLAEKYDFIILDHPFMGDAYAQQCLIDLSEFSVQIGLEDLSSDVVGQSYESYLYGGGLWALPLDASCQMALYRPDLLNALGEAAPTGMAEMRNLAKKGLFAIGLNGVHSFTLFLAICVDIGTAPSTMPGYPLVPEDVGLEALEILRELASWCPNEALDWNSIATLEAMSHRDDLLYCPYVFGFSSYSHESVKRGRLTFTNVPRISSPSSRGSVIGGTGLAMSRRCESVREAVSFASFATSRELQKAMALHAGQPARRSAWLDDEVNSRFDGFYRNTLETIDGSYLRPRYAGYMRLQSEGGDIVEGYLREPRSERDVLVELNQLHVRQE